MIAFPMLLLLAPGIANARQFPVEILCPGLATSRHVAFFYDEMGIEMGQLVVGPTVTWAWSAPVELDTRPVRAVITGATCNFEQEIPSGRAPIALVGCGGDSSPDFTSYARHGPVLWSVALAEGLRDRCPRLFETFWSTQPELSRLDQLEVLEGTSPERPLDLSPDQVLIDPTETEAEEAARLDLGAGARACLAELEPALGGEAPLDLERWDACRHIEEVKGLTTEALAAGTAPLEIFDIQPTFWLSEPALLGGLARSPLLPLALERLFRDPTNERQRKHSPFFRVELPKGPASLLVTRDCVGTPSENGPSYKVIDELLVQVPRPEAGWRGEIVPLDVAQGIHTVRCGVRGGESWVDRFPAQRDSLRPREIKP